MNTKQLSLLFIASIIFAISIHYSLSAEIHYVYNSLDDGPGSLRSQINFAESGDTIMFHPAVKEV